MRRILLIAIAGLGTVVLLAPLGCGDSAQDNAGEPAPDRVGTAEPTGEPEVHPVGHTMDLTNVEMPNVPLRGRIGGQEFILSQAVFFARMENSVEFRGENSDGQLVELGLFPFPREPLDGRSWAILTPSDEDGQPQVMFNYRDPETREPHGTQHWEGGYVLMASFREEAPMNPARMSEYRLHGQIYLCLPDEEQSWIAGTFTVAYP